MNIGRLTATLGVDTMGLYQAEQRMKSFEKTTERSIAVLNRKLTLAGTSMKTFGKNATKYLSLPLALVGGSAFMMFKKFESSMSKITGLVGVSGKQTKIWGDAILKMAPNLAKAPNELAKALYFITSAGIKGTAAMNVLTVSAKASSTGLGETKIIADLVTSAMNAYGISNLSAAKATDILIATIKEGKAEPEALASSLGMVLPIASAMSVSFDQVGGAIAAMTRTGTPAATAAMQLRQILASFLKPTTASEKILNDMGTTLKKVDTGFRAMGTSSAHFRDVIKRKGLLSALLELKTLSSRYGETLMGKVFPNVRAVSGVLDMMGKNVQSTISVFDGVTNSTDSLKKALEAASKTAQMKWNSAIAQGKTSLIIFGKYISKAFLPILQKMVGILKSVTKWFSNLSESSKKTMIIIGGLLLVIGPIMTILGFLVGNVLPGLLMIGSKLIVMFDALKLAMMTNPITAWITGITIAVGIIYSFMRNTDDAANAQDRLNKQLEIAKKLTTQTNNLKTYFSMISKMNKQQLIEYKEKIRTQIKLENDAFLKKEVDKKIAEKEEKKIMAIGAMMHKKYEEHLHGINKDSNKKILTNDVLTHAQRLESLNAYLDAANKAIKNKTIVPKPIVISGQIITVEQGKIMDEMIKKITHLNSLEKAYGSDINLTSDKISAYKEEISSLLSAGMKPLSKYIQDLIKKQNDLTFALKKADSPLVLLKTKLKEIANKEKILGKSYDTTKDSLNAYTSALQKSMEKGKLTEKEYLLLTKIIMNLKTKLEASSIDDIFKNVPFQLQKASEDAKIFGTSFDLINAKISIYKNALMQLQNTNGIFTPQQIKGIKKYVEALRLLMTKLKEVPSLTEQVGELASSFQEVGGALDNTTGSWLNWIGKVLTSLPKIIKMIQMIGVITKVNTALKIGEGAADASNTVIQAAGIGVTQAKTAADAGASITGATKAGASIPFPGNLIAIAVGVAAVISALLMIPKAKGATKMATGGIIPDGFLNDSFPAMLQSKEAVIPLKEFPKLLGDSFGKTEQKVIFHIKGKDLEGVLKNMNTYNQSF